VKGVSNITLIEIDEGTYTLGVIVDGSIVLASKQWNKIKKQFFAEHGIQVKTLKEFQALNAKEAKEVQ